MARPDLAQHKLAGHGWFAQARFQGRGCRYLKPVERAILAYGIWEYYHSLTGKGLGQKGLGMSTIIIDMLKRFGRVKFDDDAEAFASPPDHVSQPSSGWKCNESFVLTYILSEFRTLKSRGYFNPVFQEMQR